MSYERMTPCRPEDVNYVFDHLWERGVVELEGLGRTVEDGRQAALRRIAESESCAILYKGEPVCVLGHVDNATWFQATEAFTEHFEQITREMRDISEGRDFVIYSQCIHRRTEKWFRLCGYERVPEWQGETVTGKPVYMFRRSPNVL